MSSSRLKDFVRYADRAFRLAHATYLLDIMVLKSSCGLSLSEKLRIKFVCSLKNYLGKTSSVYPSAGLTRTKWSGVPRRL